MVRSHFEPVLWLALLGSPLVLMGWLLCAADSTALPGPFARRFVRLVAVWAGVVAGALVLPWLRLTQVF